MNRAACPWILATFGLLSCGPKGGPSHPADLGSSPALAYVPARVGYVAVVRRVDQAVAATRDLVEVLGMLGEYDLEEIDGELGRYLGVDPLSVDDLADAGVDLAAGAVVFGTGFSPTLVFQLADPARMQDRIDRQREAAGEGAAVGVAVRDNVEVYTALSDRELHTHWAIDGKWMWLHFEIVDEHEPELGWFDTSRAARGAFVKDPDLAWARAQGDKVQPGAAAIGFLHPVALASHLAKLAPVDDATRCLALVTAPRVAFTIGAGGGTSEGHVLVDTAGAGAALAKLVAPVPAGWSAASKDAPIVFEWNLDAARVGAWFRTCDGAVAVAVDQLGISSGRAFLAALSPDDLSGRGALAVELSSRAHLDELLGSIPGRSMLEKKQVYAGHEGRRISAPMIPSIDYVVEARAAYAALGDGVLAAMLGDGAPVAPSRLARLEVRPRGLSEGAWDLLLQNGLDVHREGARRGLIARLSRWAHGAIELTLDGDLLHLTARGERP